MGVNGQKLNFQANGRRWQAMGWKQPGIASSPYLILQQHLVITFLSMKGEVGSRGHPKANANGGKWQKFNFQAISNLLPFTPICSWATP